MKCPKTGEYIMLMHADDMGYKDPYIGLATCKTIAGDYQLQGPLLYKGQTCKNAGIWEPFRTPMEKDIY